MPSKHKRPTARTVQNGPVSNPVSSQPQSTQPHKINSRENKPVPVAPSEADLPTGDTTEDAGESVAAPSVNRKKQKRREKEAAKRAAQHSDTYTNGYDDHYVDSSAETPVDVHLLSNGATDTASGRRGRGPVKGYFTEETEYIEPHYQPELLEDEEFYSNDDENDYEHNYIPRTDRSWLNTSKRKKALNRRARPRQLSHTGANARPVFPTLSNAALRSAHKMSGGNDHIWNTSTLAERENIKQFWLELGEDERRKLLRVEKEAVLRKMKEQQKHSCSCSVCGRKRTAIEEELEVLYEAYYQELEQFANHDGTRDSPRSMPPPRHPVAYRDSQHPMAGAYPVQGRIRELDENGDEIDEDEEYDEDDEDAYSDEEYDDGPADFFEFGNSLTVKDGILTVADDLLKNDGKQFIDMMEQLAEKRLQREEEIHYPVPPVTHQSSRKGYHQPPIDDEEDFDDEDDDDYDSQDEDDDFETDEMDSMTEDQRMEEGRRMFQIFAARMFEQRVLTAYKEKMAEEKQAQLLRELEEELEAGGEREAKKARDAAKRKDKKARQKAAQAEEKAKREAEKAAEEAAAKAIEEAKLAEKKKKQEEQRRKKDAERKAAEEDRLKKETEKVARLQKEREKQQEIERKNKEIKEREKKLKEEQRKKEKEDRDKKEAEARERKRQEQEKLQQEAQERKAQAEAVAKAEKDAKERTKMSQSLRRQPIVLPPGLQNPIVKSPVLATSRLSPAALTGPGAPATTTRTRQTSQPSQPSHSSSPQSQQASTEVSQSSMSPASFSTPQLPQGNYFVNHARQAAPLHHAPNSMSRSPVPNLGRAVNYPYNPANMHGMGVNGVGVGVNGPGQVTNTMPPLHNMYSGPPMGGHPRFGPNSIPPPGFNGVRPFPSQLPFYPGPPSSIPSVSQGPMGQHSLHARHASGSDSVSQPAPIGRPGPIARPSSVTPEKEPRSESDINRITTMLGSSALLDGSDEPLEEPPTQRLPASALGPPGTGRLPFAGTFNDKSTPFNHVSPSWSSFNTTPGGGWSSTPRLGPGFGQSFDSIGSQQNANRSVVPSSRSLRILAINVCREHSGFQPVQHVLDRMNQLKPINIPALTTSELHAVLDTIGDAQNGGGEFRVENDPQRGQVVTWVEATPTAKSSVGDIGSPVIGAKHQYGSIGPGVIGSHHGSGGAHGLGPPGRQF